MTNISATLIIVLYIIAQSEANEYDWNKYCDTNDKHLLCFYATKTQFECDDKNLTISNVIESEKESILKKFNEFRNSLAKNEFSLQGDRKIGECSRMQELKWDPFLEEMAKARCMRCNYEYMNPIENIILESFIPGEMIASPSHPGMDLYGGDENWNDNILNAVDNIWIIHKEHFDISRCDNDLGRLPYVEYHEQRKGQNELLYSTIQVFKDDHYMIGCARSSYKEGDKTIYFYSCFTGASKVATKETVVIYCGPPASNCIDNIISTNHNYTGLCSSADEINFPQVFVIEDKCLLDPNAEGCSKTEPTNDTTNTNTDDTILTDDGSTQYLDDTNSTDDRSTGDKGDDLGDGSKSSRNRCYWSFFFFCFTVAIFME